MVVDSDKQLTLEKSPGGYFTSFGYDSNQNYITYYSSPGMLIGYGSTTGAAPTVNTLFLKTDGKVGIGTTSPASQLHVSGSGAKFLMERSANDAIIEVKTSTAGAYFVANSATTANFAGLELQGGGSNLWFIGQYGYADFSITDGSKNAGTRHFTVQNTTGNVGIGTTSPTKKLSVTGTISASANITAHGNIIATGSILGSSATFTDVVNMANNKALTLSLIHI